MSKLALDRLITKFPTAVVSHHANFGDETAVIKPDELLPVMTFLRDDPELSFEMLMDLTGVDYLGVKEPRFEVVYHLYSLSKKHRLRIKVELPEADPRTPSVFGLWKSANWMEREAFDLYGIKFDGHPDLRRVLLYPEFEGHPLRKDYEMEHRQPLIPPRAGREHL
ncbi:MAG: NADH-quinone oxidoreductase subunit C [Deltaproteobacteria bacterium]|nr:NADH-quinone oxidoreductase subunit C [Deltaproteobacteria bacterium]